MKFFNRAASGLFKRFEDLIDEGRKTLRELLKDCDGLIDVQGYFNGAWGDGIYGYEYVDDELIERRICAVRLDGDNAIMLYVVPTCVSCHIENWETHHDDDEVKWNNGECEGYWVWLDGLYTLTNPTLINILELIDNYI